LRRPGSVRRVEPVKVSAKAPSQIAAVLEPSNRAAELADAIELLDGGLGDTIARAQAQAGLAGLADLLGIEQVVVVEVQPGEGQYRAFVYAADGGARLAVTDITVGDRELEQAFASAGAALYRQVAKAKVVVKPRKPRRRTASGPSIFSRWWFWTGVGVVVAAGVAVPVVMKLSDGPDPNSCPSGQSCGTVVFRF
jgi:hypothetical protein